MTRNAFGPNLRRHRLQRGVTLEQIANATKVSRDLFDGLERNDFSNWPSGIYARAYVRQYAYAIGLDPDSTVDEFCRWFDRGDRRAERVVRGQSEIVGHSLTWQDDLPVGNRRAALQAIATNGARAAGPQPAPAVRPAEQSRPSRPAETIPNGLRFLARLRRAFGRT